MTRSNTVSPGKGKTATISNRYKHGRIRTFSSETSGSTGYAGRQGNGVQFSII
jgi:hypothetical protein